MVKCQAYTNHRMHERHTLEFQICIIETRLSILRIAKIQEDRVCQVNSCRMHNGSYANYKMEFNGATKVFWSSRSYGELINIERIHCSGH